MAQLRMMSYKMDRKEHFATLNDKDVSYFESIMGSKGVITDE